MRRVITNIIWHSSSEIFSAILADDIDMMYSILPWEYLDMLSHWLHAVHKAKAITSPFLIQQNKRKCN